MFTFTKSLNLNHCQIFVKLHMLRYQQRQKLPHILMLLCPYHFLELNQYMVVWLCMYGTRDTVDKADLINSVDADSMPVVVMIDNIDRSKNNNNNRKKTCLQTNRKLLKIKRFQLCIIE